MATRLQRETAKLALQHPTMEKKALVALGGYGKAVQKTPSKVLDSIGFKESLAEFGLTEEFITTALVSDIESKPGKRLPELNLGAEILNMKKQKVEEGGEKTVVAIQVIINGRADNVADRTDSQAV